MKTHTQRTLVTGHEKSAPGFKKAKDMPFPLFAIMYFLINIHIFDYPDSRLSGLFTQVPMSPDSRGPIGLFFAHYSKFKNSQTSKDSIQFIAHLIQISSFPTDPFPFMGEKSSKLMVKGLHFP